MSLLRHLILATFCLLGLSLPLPAMAQPAQAIVPVATAVAEAGLVDQAYLLWQWVNEARRQPRQAMARLGIDEGTARAALGTEAWILDQGLPPLAWDQTLRATAQGHGRDMIAGLYYSQISPAGTSPASRMAAAGYAGAEAAETLGALVFQNYLAPEEALLALFDNMLRDELTATPGVGRNIFSPTLSEVGIGFLAESVALLDGRPYVYLLVLDFARPASPRHFVIGRSDAGSRLMVRNLYTGLWDVVPQLPHGSFQVQLASESQAIYSVNAAEQVTAWASSAGLAADRNYSLDLRSPGGQD